MIRSRSANTIPVVAGAILGVFGALLFVAVHAVLISPIWASLLGGLPISLAVGAACGLAFALIWQRTGMRAHIVDGAKFGGLLWLSLLPMTLLAAVIRWAGRHDPESSLEVVELVIVAAAAGVGIGYLAGRHRGGAAAFSVATVLLVLAMGGPIAVGASERGLRLYASFGVLLPLCGALLVITMTALEGAAGHREPDSRDESPRHAAPN